MSESEVVAYMVDLDARVISRDITRLKTKERIPGPP